jgi:hypothetical protein
LRLGVVGGVNMDIDDDIASCIVLPGQPSGWRDEQLHPQHGTPPLGAEILEKQNETGTDETM